MSRESQARHGIAVPWSLPSLWAARIRRRVRSTRLRSPFQSQGSWRVVASQSFLACVGRRDTPQSPSFLRLRFIELADEDAEPVQWNRASVIAVAPMRLTTGPGGAGRAGWKREPPDDSNQPTLNARLPAHVP